MDPEARAYICAYRNRGGQCCSDAEKTDKDAHNQPLWAGSTHCPPNLPANSKRIQGTKPSKCACSQPYARHMLGMKRAAILPSCQPNVHSSTDLHLVELPQKLGVVGQKEGARRALLQ